MRNVYQEPVEWKLPQRSAAMKPIKNSTTSMQPGNLFRHKDWTNSEGSKLWYTIGKIEHNNEGHPVISLQGCLNIHYEITDEKEWEWQ